MTYPSAGSIPVSLDGGVVGAVAAIPVNVGVEVGAEVPEVPEETGVP